MYTMYSINCCEIQKSKLHTISLTKEGSSFALFHKAKQKTINVTLQSKQEYQNLSKASTINFF